MVRHVPKWVATLAYSSTVLILVVGLAVVLPAGNRIQAAPQVPEFGRVTGSAQACLGETVSFLQSGEFLSIHPGASDGGGYGVALFDGRIDRASGTVILEGRCLDDTGPATVHATVLDDTGLDGVIDTADGTLELRVRGFGEGDVLTGTPRLGGGALLSRILLASAVVIVAARLLGGVFRRIGQPRVIGEITAGILLGPSLLGLVFPQATEFLFPRDVTDVLSVLAQFGLIFFMFIIGLELDHTVIRQSGRSAVMISHFSIVLPLVLGVAAALVVYPTVGSGNFTGFALFMGAAMAITAFPVLARILTDTGLHKTRLGALAITCAAVDDVTAWCVLSVVVAIVKATGPADAVITVAMSLVFMAVMWVVVRPLAGKVMGARKGRPISATVVSFLVAGLFLSAWATEMIGIHAIFGAFMFGAILPRERGVASHVIERFEDVTVLVLLPIFFAVVGLSTRIGLVTGRELWMLTGLIIVIAVVGKVGGSLIAGLAAGETLRSSTVIGILMNARGITEIVILTVGRELGVISPALFTIMVLMALTTTVMTTPLLSRAYPRHMVERDMLIEHHRANSSHERRVMVGVTDPRTARPLVKIAGWFRDQQDRPATVLLAAVVSPPGHEHVRASMEDLATSSARAAGNLASVVDALEADGIRAEVMTRVGTDPTVELDLLIRQQAVDLLLIGAHEGYLRRRPLGGVVRGLLSTVPCDVIVVLRGERIGANDGPVGVVVSGDAGDIAVAEAARSIAKGRGGHLVVIRPTGVDPDPAVTWAETDIHAGPEAASDVSMLVVAGPDEDRIDVVERMSAERRLPVLVLRPAEVSAVIEGAKV